MKVFDSLTLKPLTKKNNTLRNIGGGWVGFVWDGAAIGWGWCGFGIVLWVRWWSEKSKTSLKVLVLSFLMFQCCLDLHGIILAADILIDNY